MEISNEGKRMKNFWIVVCISSIGILMGVLVFAGISYAENQRVLDAFQEMLLEPNFMLHTETDTAGKMELLLETGNGFGLITEAATETKLSDGSEGFGGTGVSSDRELFAETGTADRTGLVLEVDRKHGLGSYTGTVSTDKLERETKELADVERREMDGFTAVEGENRGDLYLEGDTVKEAIGEAESTVDLVPELVIAASQGREDGKVRLLFSGDVYFSDTFLNAYDAGGVNGILDSDVLGLMTGADITMVNQEFAFSERGTAMEDKQYTFRLPPSRVKIFQEMGVDVVSLANNHALDFGTVALEDSFAALDQAGILYVGAGGNLDRAKEMQTITVNGKVIGFLAASRVIPVVEWNAGSSSTGMFTTYSPELLCRAIAENRERCDYLVVFVHWGVERNTYPEDYQFRMGKQYIDAGADAVIGCHPHVMQGVEYYQGKPIAYSLGNYIFNLRSASTSLLQLEIEENGEVTAELIPVRTDALPFRLLTGEEKTEFYQYMESISFQISIAEDGIIRYNK